MARSMGWFSMTDKRTPQRDEKAAAAEPATDSYSVDPLQLVRRIEGKGPAPVHLWDPPYCGDMDMIIRRDGSWIHEGTAIRRAAMVQLFASVLKREGDNYYLVTPVEKIGIEVEDCPFVACEMDVEGSGKSQKLRFTTNVGETVVAGPEHQIRVEVSAESAEPHPLIHIRNGLNALINRAVFYRLVDLAEQTEIGTDGEAEILTCIYSDGLLFELGRQKKGS
mgnify:FL=1|jgi:uncharacterized protein